MIHFCTFYFHSKIFYNHSLKSKKQKKQIVVDTNDIDDDELVLKTEIGGQIWKNYKKETRHSNKYFKDQKERIDNILSQTQKRVDILESHALSLKALSMKASINKNRPTTISTVTDFQDEHNELFKLIE